jgi:S-(hydroxymethyl)glutathione dehydrogenase/alcohol dehydrogenase
MRAAILFDTDSELIIENGLQIPRLGKGQVLVKLAYSGVCHSQIMEIDGLRGDDRYIPHLLGHEGTGKVLSVGDGVTKVKPGDWVVLGWIKAEGIDAGGSKYLLGDKTVNAGAVTTFNEQAIVSENRLVLLPKGVPLDIGVLFGCAMPTGAGIILNKIKPKNDHVVLIYGLGGVGLSALMALKLFKCKEIIVVDTSDNKLNLAAELGAGVCLNPKYQDIESEVNKITSGIGVDYAIEAAGSVITIEAAFRLIRKEGGVCVFASHPPLGQMIKIDPFELISGKEIHGSWGGYSRPDVDIPILATHYLNGTLPLSKMINKIYNFDDINLAISDLRKGDARRPVILINKELDFEYQSNK